MPVVSAHLDPLWAWTGCSQLVSKRQYTWVSAVERVVIEHPTRVLPFIAEFAPSLVLASYFRFLPGRGLLISLCAVRSSALCTCVSHNLSQRQDNEQSCGAALESTPHHLPQPGATSIFRRELIEVSSS